MYLSRVEIDFNNRLKTKNLTHLGAFHDWVEQCFPNEIESGVRTRKLWRIDALNGVRYLLIVSEAEPDFKQMERYGVTGTAQSKPYDEFVNRLTNGMTVRFKVTANPVYSVADGTQLRKRGRVFPHITVAQQMEFFQQKAEKNGFAVNDDEVTITERGFEVLRKSNQKPVQLSKATYEGRLTITDVELFKKVLLCGLGKKKAYGFGLMTVIPER